MNQHFCIDIDLLIGIPGVVGGDSVVAVGQDRSEKFCLNIISFCIILSDFNTPHLGKYKY